MRGIGIGGKGRGSEMEEWERNRVSEEEKQTYLRQISIHSNETVI